VITSLTSYLYPSRRRRLLSLLVTAVSLSSAAPPALLSLRDDTFDLANPAAYQLDVLVAGGHCRLAVLDVSREKVVVLEDHPLTTVAELPALAAGHDLLSHTGWARVRLAVGGGAFTLLPAPLFRPGDEATYLALHAALAPEDMACAYTLPPASPAHELVSVFAANRAVANWLHHTHGAKARLVHHTSALLAGLLHQRGPVTTTRHLFLNLNEQELTAVVLGFQLEFCNVFTVNTPEDVVYYTILVMQEMGLSPDQDVVTVWGELTKDSATYQLLSTYVRYLRFGSRPFGLQYCYRLNEVAECRHFDLFSLAFCQ
jgi:hypothetical protein